MVKLSPSLYREKQRTRSRRVCQICLVLDLVILGEVEVERSHCYRRHLVVDVLKHRTAEVFFRSQNGLCHYLVHPEQ